MKDLKDLIDNSDMQAVLDKLENLEDEQLATELLREFNDRSAILGKLIMNLDKELTDEEWKSRCDEAKKSVDETLQKIKDL